MIVLLEQKFKHKYWFKESNITVKEFLDYVLTNSSNFIIQVKNKCRDNYLFNEPSRIYYLNDGRYSYKLNLEEQRYLSDRDEYFRTRLA